MDTGVKGWDRGRNCGHRKVGEKVHEGDEEVSQVRLSQVSQSLAGHWQDVGFTGSEMGISLDVLAECPGIVFFPEMY